jgi:hypothetical protein
MEQEADDPSLTPPLAILDHVQILREILLVYESSLGDEAHLRGTIPEGGNDTAADGCRIILDRMVDPAIEMCVIASEEKHKARPAWDREVFVINAMTYLQVVTVSRPSWFILTRARHHLCDLERTGTVRLYTRKTERNTRSCRRPCDPVN